MTERKKQIAVAVLVVWLLLIMFSMILARNVSIEIFFVLWLSGLLVIVELIGPSFVQPTYLRRIKFLIIIGVMVFALIIVQKLMEILRT
jgi:hypothetical protein